MRKKEIIQFYSSQDFLIGKSSFRAVNLTLEGWERYELEKRGQLDEGYGFLAMKFNDDELDEFVRSVLKPAVKTGTGFEVIDMRDRPVAGIIDDILRIKIRNAKFVIVDLTHDNNGAYWEAGYAEGLGKPVIYICNEEKFKTQSTHFDTNHCTTIPWASEGDIKPFQEQLIATIKRSLDDNPEEAQHELL